MERLVRVHVLDFASYFLDSCSLLQSELLRSQIGMVGSCAGAGDRRTRPMVLLQLHVGVVGVGGLRRHACLPLAERAAVMRLLLLR